MIVIFKITLFQLRARCVRDFYAILLETHNLSLGRIDSSTVVVAII